MPTLPKLSGRTAVRVFSRDRWELARQKGSHTILVKANHWSTPSVPDHREVAPGTLRTLIRASGLTVEQFLELTKK